MLFGLPSWETLRDNLFFKIGWLIFWGTWVVYWLHSIWLDHKQKTLKITQQEAAKLLASKFGTNRVEWLWQTPNNKRKGK